MSKYIHDDTSDENIDEVDDDLEQKQSLRISNSIHNFAEIISNSEANTHEQRFNGLYNPRRRKLLTETDQDNVKANPNDPKDWRKNERVNYNFGKSNKFSGDENEPMEENKRSNKRDFEEFDEEVYEEVSSQDIETDKHSSHFGEHTFEPSLRPSSNRDTTGKLKYIDTNDNDIPEFGSSEENKSDKYLNIDRKVIIEDQNVNDIQIQKQELKQVIHEIDYLYVDQSIQNRRWINKSIMQKRDSSRVEDKKRMEAERSLKREFLELEEKRNRNKIHTNKKSKKLAQTALKKKIKTVVSTYSQNGYLAFENFLNVFYMLQITQNIGRFEEDNHYSDRIKRVKEQKDSIELEFALQFWNKINCYLFNYVDSVILVDFLMILLNSSNNAVQKAERYIDEISQADDLPLEEIQKNRERNSDLYIEDPWS